MTPRPSSSCSVFSSPSSFSALRKGKHRAVARDEGPGGSDGIVLALEMVGSGVYDAVYTVPVRVGSNRQTYPVQVDTGSSDLWIASTTCSSQACGQTGGHLYDPSGATPTGVDFNIIYLQGNVSGPIVWDEFEIGGYSISNQALAAATSVSNEPLSSSFIGILGLALPLNSIISQLIPPVTSNSPDGASVPSNLFSITPDSSAPPSRFLSLTLSRPGSPYPPSLLGIGRHPSQIKQLFPDDDISKPMDVSKVHYSALVAERNGILFWKVGVRAITIYKDGERRPVNIGRSGSGSVFPTAVLDSGVPLILTTSPIANGIYGAIGIGPGSDGKYYVPCNTPLNMTITLDDRPEIPLHPLDLTAEPPKDNNAQFCIGLIQVVDGQLGTPSSTIGDMILGVPFLRNAYTVMAYDTPDQGGAFPNNDTDNTSSSGIKPRLGLLSLTDPTVALDEFNRVRVLNQPLTSGSQSASDSSSGDRKLSVGIEVLIGLLSFFALCFTLFGIRWFLSRRKWRHATQASNEFATDGDHKGQVYQLARRGSRGSIDLSSGTAPPGLSEDELRALRFAAYMKKERVQSEYTMSSGQTRVAPEGEGDVELGFKNSKVEDEVVAYGEDQMEREVDGDSSGGIGEAHSITEDPWDPLTALDWGNHGVQQSAVGQPSSNHDDSSPERSRTPHHRTLSEADAIRTHDRGQSISVPLLSGQQGQAYAYEDDLAEFGAEPSMAGVGTAARSSHIDQQFRQSSLNSENTLTGLPVNRRLPRSTTRPRPNSTVSTGTVNPEYVSGGS